jgi:hypothetical protein
MAIRFDRREIVMKALGLVVAAVGLLGLATTSAYAEAGQNSDQELRRNGIPNIMQQQRIERYRQGQYWGMERQPRRYHRPRHHKRYYRY